MAPDMRLALLLLSVSLAGGAPGEPPMMRPNCPEKCGNISVPYPFGLKPGCFRDGFGLFCNDTNDPPRLYMGYEERGKVSVIDISLPRGELRTPMFIARHCLDKATGKPYSNDPSMTLAKAYLFSARRNKFTVIGCSTLALIEGRGNSGYATGCVSFCRSPKQAAPDGAPCTGRGCCQTAIPEGLNYFHLSWTNYTVPTQDSPCSYAMLVQEDSYHFDQRDVADADFFVRYGDKAPIVLDWAIRDGTCSPDGAGPKTPDYACVSDHSHCVNSTNGPGYICNCSQGYDGNPYLVNGCQDIDECQFPEKYPCKGHCNNTLGSYECSCPSGKEGNATTGDCRDKFPLAAKLGVGCSVGVAILLAFLSTIAIMLQKRKHENERKDLFKQNGGLMLYDEMKSRGIDTFSVYTEKEIEKATDGFGDDRIRGVGGRGTVYHGRLNGRDVAVKRPKEVSDVDGDDFVNEIIVLSQINHRNIVKILGCCLEVSVPILIYEFISYGTLFDLLHGKGRASLVSLDARLKIAVESAEALTYMHSLITPPILHGDIKSPNILVDDNYNAKISDFGTSKLMSLDDKQFAILVQGTAGYLDPETIQSRQLTPKSDVYSFGVVLLEIITRKPAKYKDSDNTKETKSLAASFISAVEENRLCDILDSQLIDDGAMEVLQEVAELAMRCLSLKGKDRPTMREVAEGLQMLGRFKKHSWGQMASPSDAERLLKQSPMQSPSSTTMPNTTDTHALALDIDLGR